jgi:hypothetical protein
MEKVQLIDYEKAQLPRILDVMLKTREKLGFEELVGNSDSKFWVYKPEGMDSWLEIGTGDFHRSYIESYVYVAGLRLPTYRESLLLLMNDKKLKEFFTLKGFEVEGDEKINGLPHICTINEQGEFVEIENNARTSKEALERSVETLHGNRPLRLCIYGYAEDGVPRYHLDATDNHAGHHLVVGVPQDWKIDNSLLTKLLRKRNL